MKSQVQTITPRQASEMLKGNTKNRKIRIKHVNQLKTEILSGRWIVTHQGIAFADDGTLIDGQHRLMAIEAAGRDVQLLVTTGVPKFHNGDINLDTMDVIDNGKMRSTADQLNLSHGVHQANKVVGALRTIAAIAGGTPGTWSKIGTLSVGQANALLEIYGEGLSKMLSIAGRSKLCCKTAIVAALTYAYPTASVACEKFMKDLNTGNGIGKGDPVYALRESFIAFPPGGGESDRFNTLLRVLMALYNTVKEVPTNTAKVGKMGFEYFTQQDKANVKKINAILSGEK